MNGLQVENQGLVGGIVAAVDASQATIDGVIAEGAGPRRGRRRCCWCTTGCSGTATSRSPAGATAGSRRCSSTTSPLYSAHIPLDLHPTVGNNVVLAERLGLAVEGWFGDYQGVPIGVWGHAPARLAPRDALVAEVNHALGHARARARGSSPAAPSGSAGSASSPAGPGA